VVTKKLEFWEFLLEKIEKNCKKIVKLSRPQNQKKKKKKKPDFNI
jgi:hypothetical protein